jgi:ubiquinone/menaquinone biosynthesis C-methylase UbiE
MPTQQDVSKHYTHGNLVAAIRSGIESLGKTINSITIDDLAPVDEFHTGGRRASKDFLSQLNLAPEKHVLDVGCGLGGAARFVASRFGCQVTGIDLTPEFIETAKVICGWLGLNNRVSLHLGSALAMPFADGVFDCAYMLHVGMNIADKAKLCAEVSRVLRPSSLFGIYDLMRIGDGELAYPVHWAATAAASAVATPAQYREALEKVGFVIIAERNRRDFALAQYDQLRAKLAAAVSPPPLGIHVLTGRSTPEYLQNMIENISTGRIAPVELIARKS